MLRMLRSSFPIPMIEGIKILAADEGGEISKRKRQRRSMRSKGGDRGMKRRQEKQNRSRRF